MLFDDTRSDWGARDATSTKRVAITARTEFFTHWAGRFVGLFGKSHTACLAQVKAWQNQHMDQQGWSDIGYNGLICVHARAIEGRGRDFAGAHCSNHNTSGLGWQFMVGPGENITAAMFARMRRAYDDCSAASGKALAKRTHSDGFNTECGGAQCRTWTHAGMPVTTAPAKEWWEMAIPQAELDRITQDVWTHGADTGKSAWVLLATASAQVSTLTAAVQALAESKGADAAAITQAVVDKINALDLTLAPKSGA